MVVIVGVRQIRTVLDDGEFFCPECGGDRRYQYGVGGRLVSCSPGLPMFPVSKALGGVKSARCAGSTSPARSWSSPPHGASPDCCARATRSLAAAALVAGGRVVPGGPCRRRRGRPRHRPSGAYTDTVLDADLRAYGPDDGPDGSLGRPRRPPRPRGLRPPRRRRRPHRRRPTAPTAPSELDMLLTAGNRLRPSPARKSTASWTRPRSHMPR
ncbi:hypothetical protein ACU686_18065 [Yinghuangia aomiensis]